MRATVNGLERWTLLLLTGGLAGALAAGCGGDGPGGDPDAGVDAPTDTSTDGDTDAAPPECTYAGGPAEALDDPPRHTPRWAFQPWISKDISTGPDTRAFVEGFLSRDIPLGAVVIDSPWETHYNTLVPNEERYPDFAGMVEWLHGMDVRIVLWTTQMVNLNGFDAEDMGDTYRGPAPNYTEGRVCGFYVNEGAAYGWWKGRGSGVDFFHPEAVGWWRGQQDLVLGMGVDGWKLDFGESYIRDAPESYAEIRAFDGTHTIEEYSEAYYQDFLRYGVHVRGEEFVTMVRAWDASYDVPGRFYARPEHAPVVWLGDNHRDWSGVTDVLDHAFRSARAGYVVVGSDIGGYLDRDQENLSLTIPFDEEVFQRWVALSGMMPFFQLHGRANLEPWNIGDETLALYRYWATLHSEMVPFWYSLAEEAYARYARPDVPDADPSPVLVPLGDAPAAWEGDYRFFVGEAFLVAPLLGPGGTRDVTLPAGTFYDFWSDARLDGGATLADYDGASAAGRIPLFVREGAIVPMDVASDVTGFGTAASAGHLTILSWPGATESRFVLHDEDDAPTTLTAQDLSLTASRLLRPTLVRLTAERISTQGVARVLVDGAEVSPVADLATLGAAASGYVVMGPHVWAKAPAGDASVTVTVELAPTM